MNQKKKKKKKKNLSTLQQQEKMIKDKIPKNATYVLTDSRHRFPTFFLNTFSHFKFEQLLSQLFGQNYFLTLSERWYVS